MAAKPNNIDLFEFKQTLKINHVTKLKVVCAETLLEKLCLQTGKEKNGCRSPKN